MDQKENFLREVNKAFQEGNTEFLLNNVTDDFCWTIVGEKTVGGKIEFAEALEQMNGIPPMKIQVQKAVSYTHLTLPTKRIV